MPKGTQFCFERREKKYMLTPDASLKLLSDIKKYVRPDDYAWSEINNIYYDTDDYALIRASIEKPVYKEKLRLRSYGTPTDTSPVFIELKKKFDGVVYKRRIQMQYLSALRRLNGAGTPGQDQISREINWFVNRAPLSPKVFIGYNRASFAGICDKGLRITFDTNIIWRTADLDLKSGFYGHSLPIGQNVLMEIKMPGSAPVWLARVLSENEIFPAPFSKYGEWFKNFAYTKVAPLVQGVVSCA